MDIINTRIDIYAGQEGFFEHFSDLSIENLQLHATGNLTIEQFVQKTPKPLQRNTKPTFQPSFLRRSVDHFVSLFMTSTGVNAQQRHLSPFNANNLLGIYTKYLAIPLFLAAQIVQITASYFKAVVITGIVGAVVSVALFVYIKFFKMAPQRVPCGIHLLSFKGNEEVVARKEQIEQLNQLIQWTEENKVPFSAALLAKPGEGKSSVIKAFALEHQEDYLVYSLRTPELLKSFEGMGDQLSYIRNTIGKQEKKVVLVFEEFDAALKSSENMLLLYSLLDDEGIACIPVMNPETYDKSEDSSFARRFLPVRLKNEGEIFDVWYENLLRYYHRCFGGDVYIENTMFKKIIEAAKNEKYAAPASGVNLLLRAIRWVRQGRPQGTLVDGEEKKKLQEEIAQHDFLNGDDVVVEEEQPSESINQKRAHYETIRKVSKCYYENQLQQEKLAEKIRIAQSYSERDERDFILLRKVLHVKLREKLKDLIENGQNDEQCYFPHCIDEELIKRVQTVDK